MIKYIFSVISLCCSTHFLHGQEILLIGDSTSMVNVYGDATLLSLDMQSNAKAPKTYIANGFRIQLIAATNRKEAEQLKAQFTKKNPKEFAILRYDEPNYKIYIGNYIDRTQAEAALAKVIKAYPNAVIIEDKILITPKR